MELKPAAALAHPNIAFIKYWGNRDEQLRLPQSGSISMNLASLHTETTVRFSAELEKDTVIVNSQPLVGDALARVTRLLDKVRSLAGKHIHAEVASASNFPIGAGIASSASAFAALALAGSSALGLSLSESELSRLARSGSGSAARSIPGGFCEWVRGESDLDSFSFSILPQDGWDLSDLIVLFSHGHKKVGSTAGHSSASTSPYQAARIQDAPRRLDICRKAILERDFSALAEISEQDSTLMHAVMMTQQPPLFYWEPQSLAVIKAVKAWRASGLLCFATLDAGPNVHVICPTESRDKIHANIQALVPENQILVSGVGGPARLINPTVSRRLNE